MLNRAMTTTLDRMLTLNRALDEAFTNSVIRERERAEAETAAERGGFGNGETARVWVPAIDLIERKDAYIVRAELPGVDRANIDITFEKGILTISGQKSAMLEANHEELRVFAAERVSGGFSRSLRMPDHIDGDRISADYKDGLLTITIPKAELAQPRKIEVK